MGIRWKSLSEDTVDSITHTWCVGLFLFLSFILLVIPAAQHQITAKDDNKADNYPTLDVSCWCPAQFEPSQVMYTNKVCALDLNNKIRGIKNDVEPVNNSAKEPHFEDILKQTLNNIFIMKNKTKPKSENKEKKSIVRIAVNSPPVFLLLLAVGLRLPKLLVTILNQCAGSFNMEETLESAKKGGEMEREKRKEFYEDLITPLTRQSSCFKSHSCFYTLTKILLIVAIVAEINVVHETALASTQPNLGGENTTDIPQNGTFHCSYKVRQVSYVHDYTVQCVYEIKETAQEINSNQQHVSAESFIENLTLKSMTLVLVILACLLAVNVINTVVWFLSFVLFGYLKNVSSDAKLLAHLARINLSATVASDLSELVSNKSDQNLDDSQVPLKKL